MKTYNLHEIMSNAWAMYRKWVAPYKYNHSRIPSCYTFASALKQAWAAARPLLKRPPPVSFACTTASTRLSIASARPSRQLRQGHQDHRGHDQGPPYL